jgi:hypothetical protein
MMALVDLSRMIYDIDEVLERFIYRVLLVGKIIEPEYLSDEGVRSIYQVE